MSAVPMPSTFPRRGTFSDNPDDYAESISAVCAKRDRWLRYGLKAGPSDRTTAESAVAQLYRRAGFDAPEFVWVPSPAAAASFVTAEQLVSEIPTTAAKDEKSPARIASLLSNSRRRMDERIDKRRIEWPRWYFHQNPNMPSDREARMTVATRSPEDAARAGISPDPIIRRTVWDSLRTSLFDGVASATRSLAPQSFGSITWYGQQEAHRVAYYDIYRTFHLAAFEREDNELLDIQSALVESTGWWWAFDDVAVMSERPTAVHTEPVPNPVHGEVRLHNSSSPAVEFGDGSGVHVLNGTVVPKWVIHDPTVERITVERNVEIRRSAIERIGWDNYLDRAGLRLVDTDADPGNPGCTLQLFATPAGWGSEGRILLAVNGSRERDGERRRYGLRVPGAFSSAVDAAGWTYGLAGADYGRLLRRT
ncbi:DUF6745 domain-containing protein [Rhodococcus sp. 14-2496-1d]|uniref:DUF6745 domain-containing protein n=1 Tax=Rhodococcus sp. 14-2496-1d TaxID=2023146 RepID=UPI00211AC0FA|nr:hypothetical protein [Rhodococcus sp. 14-2496-1d]